MKKVEVNGENFQKQIAIASVIHKHFNDVEQATGGLSTRHHMIKHPSFQALIAMGDKIVNYVFHLMFESGSCWRYLELIPRIIKNPPKVPVEIAGDFYRQTIFWMSWYVESEYYKNNDVYFNLVDPDEEKISEHSIVILKEKLVGVDIPIDTVGTIVHIYSRENKNDLYEVEFIIDGKSIVTTVLKNHIKIYGKDN